MYSDLQDLYNSYKMLNENKTKQLAIEANNVAALQENKLFYKTEMEKCLENGFKMPLELNNKHKDIKNKAKNQVSYLLRSFG